MSKPHINDIPLTKYEMMNRDHKEFIDILNSLIAMENDSGNNNERKIDAGLDQLLKHTKQHFSKEEELMLKANFPPYTIHKGEHDRILKILKDSIIHWHLNRDRKIIKGLIESVLPDWLIQHIATMDCVTAQFLDNTDSLKYKKNKRLFS